MKLSLCDVVRVFLLAAAVYWLCVVVLAVVIAFVAPLFGIDVRGSW